MNIIDLLPEHPEHIQAAARLLITGFQQMAPHAWPDMDSALEEVQESLECDRISRVLLNDDGTVIGWIGGICHYRGNSWELHPLVVDPAYQRQGVGRRLVADLEQQVQQRGGVTLYLGSDDEMNLTSISGIDLYPNVLERLLTIQNLRQHPFEFYQKVGFEIVGILPDANGFGKPDILMAKRVANAETR